MTQSLKLSLSDAEGNIREFLDKIKFSKHKNQELWRIQLSAAEQALFGSSRNKVINQNPSLIPIESFRLSDQKAFCVAENIHSEFRSSATTRSDRAHSYFSEDGLLLYKAQSLWTFSKVLSTAYSAMNQSSAKPIVGLCLIPPSTEWVDSSLAKMAEWLKEFWPMEYIKPEELKHRARMLQEEGNLIWVLGTAFHYINLIDAKLHIELGSTTLLFETGGSKGRSRELPRLEYYQLLQTSFGLNLSQIISEYGMCELACQAYDVDVLGLKDKQNELSLSERKFRFPPWVSLYVTQGLDALESTGKGCLTVLDPLRIDYKGAIRTQDIAELTQDGSFLLQGRANFAPLKGCSLSVDEIFVIPEKNLEMPDEIDSVLEKTNWSVGNFKARCDAIKYFLENFLQQDATLAALARDLGGVDVAKSALNDLIEDFPKTPKSWLHALKNAFDFKNVEEISSDINIHGIKSWIFIAPRSHPIALLEPLSLALLAGLDVTVRLPEKFSEREGFLSRFIQGLSASLQEKIMLLPSEWRLVSSKDLQKNKALLVFGEDSTLKKIENLVQRPIRGLGTKLSFSIVGKLGLGKSEIGTNNVSQLLIKDAFALGQQGCLSSRFALFVVDEIEKEQVALWDSQLKVAFNEYWGQELFLHQRISLDHETLRYRLEQSCILANRSGHNVPLFVFLEGEKILPYQDRNRNFKAELSHLIFSKVPLCLPIILVKQKDLAFWVETIKEEFSEIKQLSCFQIAAKEISENSKSILVKSLGKANRSPWSGQQDGQGYFKLNDR